MKLFNLILVSAAFSIAAAGAIAGHQNSALTTVYGRNNSNQCLAGDPSTMQPGCTTVGASFQCTIVLYSTSQVVPAFNLKIGSICGQPFWYN
jgi:hypothetical protein